MLAREVLCRANRKRVAGRAHVLAALLACAPACFGTPFAEPVDMGHGVHAFFGAREEPNAANRGHVANQAFVVAPEGVIVIDTGASAAYAEHMRAAIRARSRKPVALVILTRPTDDAIFGASAFQADGVPVLAHEAAATLIAARCRTCLEQLKGVLGEIVMADTRVPRPDRVLRGTQRLVVAGRTLEVLDYSGAAAPGSIAIWDRESRILFAGGLASFERIPEIRDGTLVDWVRALHDLAQLPARAVIPGHGPIGNRASLESVAAYLGALDRRTARAYAARTSLLEAPQTVTVPEYRTWALYDSVHPRNVHYAYLAYERRDLARP